MRLTLQVQAGPAAGRTVVVTPDRPFYVGRTETAFLAIPDDRKLATSHFVLECTKEGCWLRDLGGRYGTFVNGEKVTRTALKHGDVITAGESKFLVGLGQQAAPANQANPAPAAAVSPPAPALAAAASPKDAPPAAPPGFDTQFLREFDARFNSGLIPLGDQAKLLTEAISLADAVATWPQRQAIENQLDLVLTTRKPQDLLPFAKGAKVDWFADGVTTAMLWVVLSVVKGRLATPRE